MDTNNYRDRQLIVRAFQAAGDSPSPELLELIPEAIRGVLADPHASNRDKVRAAECIMGMQRIQISVIGTVNQIKGRRDRSRAAATDRPETLPTALPDPEVQSMLADLEAQL